MALFKSRVYNMRNNIFTVDIKKDYCDVVIFNNKQQNTFIYKYIAKCHIIFKS